MMKKFLQFASVLLCFFTHQITAMQEGEKFDKSQPQRVIHTYSSQESLNADLLSGDKRRERQAWEYLLSNTSLNDPQRSTRLCIVSCLYYSGVGVDVSEALRYQIARNGFEEAIKDSNLVPELDAEAKNLLAFMDYNGKATEESEETRYRRVIVNCRDVLAKQNIKEKQRTVARDLLSRVAFVENINFNHYVLKSVEDESLLKLQSTEAGKTVLYSPDSLGGLFNVIDGKLTVGMAHLTQEQAVLEPYDRISKSPDKIMIPDTDTLSFSLNCDSWDVTGGVHCRASLEIRIKAKTAFNTGSIIFDSSRIELLSPVFNFAGACFFKTGTVGLGMATTIKLMPHPDLYSPIECIAITPKKLPVCIQGSIDFRNLSFDKLLISNSDILIQFKR
jgi:hypothetical protein